MFQADWRLIEHLESGPQPQARVFEGWPPSIRFGRDPEDNKPSHTTDPTEFSPARKKMMPTTKKQASNARRPNIRRPFCTAIVRRVRGATRPPKPGGR